jgi:serine/threonine protein kinase
MADDFVSVSIDSHIASCDSCNQRLTELETTHGSLLRETLQDPSLNDSTDPTPAEAQQAIDAAWRAVQQRLHEDLSAGASPVSVGQYRILERIGYGGMGSVYRAEHSQLKKVVALKLIPIQWSHPQTLQRFEREIRAAGQLQHPGIVTATDAGTQSGMQYLAMEFVDGLDLGRLMRSISPIPTADACEIARQLSLALAHAHQLGIIHRDIKPSNVMLDSKGRVKLLDFGLVHFHRWDGPVGELTTVGQFLGTLDYMAPEQAERSEVVDARSDLYSLGATLFKLLTGQTPLAMTPHQSPIEKLKRLSHHQPIQLQTLRPDLPSELCDVVKRLLATQPESRLPSALHVAEALQPFCEASDLEGLATRGLQSDHSRTSDASIQPAPSFLPSALPQSVPSASALQSPVRRLPPVWSWIALAALPLIAFFGWRIMLESDQGNLVIESASETTKIEIKRRGGDAAQEWVVQPGAQLTRLQSGYYEITIHEGSGQLLIEPNQVQLRRGETVVARVVRYPKNESSSPQLGVSETGTSAASGTLPKQAFAGVELPESVEKLLFKGKTLAEWLRVLERERDPAAWREAFEAIQKADPQLVQSLAEPLRSIGLQNNFFSMFSMGWYLPLFSHEEFDQLLMKHMEGKSLKECFGVIGYVASLSNCKVRGGEDYQASRLPNTWRFIEEKISKSDLSEVRPYFGGTPLPWTEFKDQAILAKHPWLRLVNEGVALATNISAGSNRSIESITTLLSDPELDVDQFLFLASLVMRTFDSTRDELEGCRLSVRNRLTTELRRWAKSGQVLGAFGMGSTIWRPGRDGIGFGGNNSTKGYMGGMGGGMGGMGGMLGGVDPNERIERGLELLMLCSAMPRDQRPIEEIEELVKLMRPIASRASESKSLGAISWSQVYTYDGAFLGENTLQGIRKLNEPDIAVGLLRWLDQLRFGDMAAPDYVVNQFWSALQQPENGKALEWVVASGRDQTKIDGLLKILPDSLVDLEWQIDRVDQENDRSVQRGSLRIGSVMGPDRVEITLKLEPAGWRVASFKHGKYTIGF